MFYTLHDARSLNDSHTVSYAPLAHILLWIHTYNLFLQTLLRLEPETCGYQLIHDTSSRVMGQTTLCYVFSMRARSA